MSPFGRDFYPETAWAVDRRRRASARARAYAGGVAASVVRATSRARDSNSEGQSPEKIGYSAAPGTRIPSFKEPGDQRPGSLEAGGILQAAIHAHQPRRSDRAVSAAPPIGPPPGERIEQGSACGCVAEHVARFRPSRTTLKAIELARHRHRGARDLRRRLDLKERQKLQECRPRRTVRQGRDDGRRHIRML